MRRTLAVTCFFLTTSIGLADHFDDHTAETIAATPDSKVVKQVENISASQLVSMPHPLSGYSDSGFAIVRTGEGTWCKLLLRHAF